MTETRITNAITGGQKGSKDIQPFSAPAEAMEELGRVYGHGAEKYDLHNFRKGYNWSLSYNALFRHLYATLRGEDTDPESGLKHMAHAAWHCLTLLQFVIDKEAGRQPDALDDRFAFREAGNAVPQPTESPQPPEAEYLQVVDDTIWDDRVLHNILHSEIGMDAVIPHYHLVADTVTTGADCWNKPFSFWAGQFGVDHVLVVSALDGHADAHEQKVPHYHNGSPSYADDLVTLIHPGVEPVVIPFDNWAPPPPQFGVDHVLVVESDPDHTAAHAQNVSHYHTGPETGKYAEDSVTLLPSRVNRTYAQWSLRSL